MLLRLALSQMIFGAIFQFSNLFMNTYFFKLHQDVRMAAQYNFFMFLAWGICFYFGFQLCERNTRTGLAVSGVSCLLGMVMLLAGSDSAFWLGLFMGASGGFFWPSYLSIYRTLGKESEGGSTFARVSILASAVTIVIPMLFGHLVEGKGYVIGFVVLLILSLCMVVMSYFLPAYRTEKIVLRRESFQHPGFITALSLQGFYFSFVGVAAGLLVYMTGEGEANVGTFATFYGVLTLAVNIVMGYFLPARFNKPVLLWSALIYFGSAFLFLVDWDSRVIIYNFLIAGAGPLFNNPNIGLHFAYINRKFANGEEGLFIRELALTVGRLLFFAYMALAGIDVHSPGFYIFLFAASAFPYFVYLFVRQWDKPASADVPAGGGLSRDNKEQSIS